MIVRQFESLHSGRSAIITCTHRSPEEQRELYAQGRTKPGLVVTTRDGVTSPSKHNVYPSKALDFAVLVNGKVSWDESEYVPVGEIAESMGFVWGGRWNHFPDFPHIELK